MKGSVHDFNQHESHSPALSIHQKLRNGFRSPSAGPGGTRRHTLYNFPPALADLMAAEAPPEREAPKVRF